MDFKSLLQSMDAISESYSTLEPFAVQIINDFDEVVLELVNVPYRLAAAVQDSDFDAVQWLADFSRKDPNLDMTTIEKMVFSPNTVPGFSRGHVIEVQQYLDDLKESVHKGTYGTSHGKEDVRDQYGHKIGKVNKDAETKKDEPKRTRGRPTKAAKDEHGNDIKHDTSGIQSMLGSKPSGKVGKVSAKHKLKDWIEAVEANQLNEGDQVTIAPASASTQVIKQGDKTLGTVNNPQLAGTIKQAIGQGQMTLNPDEDMTEDGGEKWIQKAIKHPGAFTKKAKAAHMGTQAFAKKHAHDSGTLGKQARLAQTLSKMHHESVEEGAKVDRMVAHVKASEKKAGHSDKEAENIAWATANKRGMLDNKNKKSVKESVSLEENKDSLEHIINRFKYEVKNFLKGAEMDNNLYDALYDYYVHSGEMPYGVAKAREGDPHEWVASRFAQDSAKHVQQQPQHTPWHVDPINAATDRVIGGAEKAGSFIKGLMAPKKNPFESKDMKDKQFESWENQLNTLLTEGLTVSSSTGQQGQPDSVSVTANDEDAQKLLSALRQAGIGVFGGEEQPGSPSAYGAPQHEEEPGHGTEIPASPEVVGDGDDMLALIKKMTGIQGGSPKQGPEGTASIDYEPEEDGEDLDHDGDLDEPGERDYQGDEEVSEGFDPVKEVKKSAIEYMQSTGIRNVHDLDAEAIQYIGDENQINYEEVCKILGCELPQELGPVNADDEVDEGNAFTGALAKAKKDGIQPGEKIKVGGKEYPVKEEHDHEDGETCNECGMYECECDSGEQVEESYANSDDDKAFQDLQYMLQTLAGGLNGPKRTQATGNIQKVTMEDTILKDSANLLTDWQKLSGIK